MPKKFISVKIPFRVFAGGGSLRGEVLPSGLVRVEWQDALDVSRRWGEIPVEVISLLREMGVDTRRLLLLDSPLFGEEERRSTDGLSLEDAPDDPAGVVFRHLQRWTAAMEEMRRVGVSNSSLDTIWEEYHRMVGKKAADLLYLLA
jgi:hypothetical protein